MTTERIQATSTCARTGESKRCIVQCQIKLHSGLSNKHLDSHPPNQSPSPSPSPSQSQSLSPQHTCCGTVALEHGVGREKIHPGLDVAGVDEQVDVRPVPHQLLELCECSAASKRQATTQGRMGRTMRKATMLANSTNQRRDLRIIA